MFDECTDGELTEAIGQMHAVSVAALSQLFAMVAEVAKRGCWSNDGSLSLAAWLVDRLGLASRTAAAWAEVAVALAHLPTIAAAFADGRVSFDQVRPLVRLATPETEQGVLAECVGCSAAQLERMARAARPPSADDADDERSRRHLRIRPDRQAGCVRLSGRLPAAEGELVEKALTRRAEAEKASQSESCSWDARYADALIGMCAAEVGADPDPDRATVIVHVNADALTSGDGGGRTEGGMDLALDTVRRLACGCRWQLVAESPEGVVRVGRMTRTPPAWMERQVRHRDQGCRFAGCGRRRWTQVHHIVHWTAGGNTDLDNLIELCWDHHHLVHEAGWSIRGDPNHGVEIFTPQGARLATGPPPLRDDVRRRLFGDDAEAA